MENVSKSMEDFISQMKNDQSQTDDLFEYPLREQLGLEKQLRSIRRSLKVKVAKKVQLEENIEKEHRKLEEFREYLGVYDDAMREDIKKRIDKLNDELKVRQKSIDLLKGRLMNQITSFCETITKLLDKDTSRAEKIRTLFREQGIMILLRFSQLSEWLSVYSLKHYYQVAVVLRHHLPLLRTKKA